MRVALLSPVFWPEVRRGTERFARELADGLLARGHEPRLIAGHAGLPSTTVEDGLPVTRVPRLPEARLRRRLYEDHLTHVPFARAALARSQADIAHALHATSALAGVASRRRSLAVAGALNYARVARPSYGSSPRGLARAAAELPGRAVLDAVEVAALARGSAKHRTLFL